MEIARKRSAAALAIAIVFAAPLAVAAQRTVSGEVVSSAGDPIGGAKVTIVDDVGVVLGTTVTDAKGFWKATVQVDAKSTGVTARVHVEGLAMTSTRIRKDQVMVRTTLAPAANASMEIEIEGDKIVPKETPSQPTRYSIDREMLGKLPGTRGDPFAAVTSLPSLGRPPALSTVYIVRGAGPEETATYFDGAPMPHAFHFGGLVAVIPPAFIDAIAIAPGGFGVAFGRATAGIVDVALAAPKLDAIHGSINLDAIDVGAVLTAPLGKSTSIAIGARRSHVDAWIGTILGDRVAGDLPRYLDGQVVVQHEISKHARIRAAFLAADDVVSVSDPTAPSDKPRSGSWRSDVMRLHVRAESEVGEKGFIYGVVSVGKSRDSIVGELDTWESARKTLFVRVEASTEVGTPEGGKARITGGIDTLATQIDGTRILTIPTSSFGGSSAFALRGLIQLQRVEPAAYLQIALSPIDGLVITPGVRLDRAPRGELVWQPRLAIRAEVSRSTALKAVSGVYARPNVYDAVDARDYEGTQIPVVVSAGPVKGVHAGVGVEHALAQDVHLVVDLYARASSGILVPVQQPARPIYETRSIGDPPNTVPGERVLVGYEYPLYSDTGRARALGAEFLLRFRTANFMGFIGYAVARAELRDGPYAQWRRAPFDQTHVLNAALVYKLGAGWELGGRFRYAAGVQDSPYPATEIAPKSDPNVDPNRPLPSLAPLHSLDVRLEKRWAIGQAGSIAAYVEVRNLYDRRAREPLAYNYVYGYPVVGNGLPIIPNIGVKGAF